MSGRVGGKWCKHCRKCDHNTSECWSTHAVDPFEDSPDLYTGWVGVMKDSLAAHSRVEQPSPFDSLLNPPTVPEWTGSATVHTMETTEDREDEEPLPPPEPEELIVVSGSTRWG